MRDWGVDEATARELAKPYPKDNMGEHFFPRRWGTKLDVPRDVIDSPLNVLRPSGISKGEFFELHYGVDRWARTFRFGPNRAFKFDGAAFGLETYGPAAKLWYGTPAPLKLVAVPTATVAGFAGVGSFQQAQRAGEAQPELPVQPQGSR